MKCFVVFLAVICTAIAALANELTGSGVTCEQKKNIVDTHNDLRGQIANGTVQSQPKATNMEKIAWDDGLQQVAQNWANKMILTHNPNKSDPRWPSIGENIGFGTDPKFDFSKTMHLWFNEHTNYTYAPVTVKFLSGHYTQLVWAKSKYVGCGATYFTGTNGLNYKFYVCNYGPSGNDVGAKPYYRGPLCSDLCCHEQCAVLYGNCTSQLLGTNPSP